MNNDSFVIDKKVTEDEVLFTLSGELDLSVAPQFRSALETNVNLVNKALILNLRDLTYIDSTGIGILISILKIRDELNAPFKVLEVPASIQRLFDLTGISKFL